MICLLLASQPRQSPEVPNLVSFCASVIIRIHNSIIVVDNSGETGEQRDDKIERR